MKDNLLDFNVSAQTLLSMAEEYSDKGRRVEAISLIRRALKQNPSSKNVLYALAGELAEAEQYKTSNDVLFKMLAADPKDSDVLLLLSQNFADLERFDLTEYYFGKFSQTDVFDASAIDVEFVREEQRSQLAGFSLVHPMSKKRAEQLKDYAAAAIRVGDMQKARNIFLEIEEAFPRDASAKSGIAFTCIISNDFENGEKYAKQALEISPDDAFALSNLACAYYLQRKDAECEEVVAKLAAVDCGDEPDRLFKIATTFCELKKDDLAYERLKRFLEVTGSLNRDVNLLCFFSAFNSKRFEQAKKILGNMLVVDPDDHIARYYKNYIDEYTLKTHVGKPKRLDYFPQIPISAMTKTITFLRTAPDFYSMWSDKKLKGQIDWAFDTVLEPDLHDELIGKVAETDKKKSTPYLKSLLLNQNLEVSVKGKVFFCLLLNGVRGKFFIVKDGFFTALDVPKNIPHVVEEEVLLCIAKLSTVYLSDEKFIAKIISVGKEVQSRVIECGLVTDWDIAVMAACIARNCGFEQLNDETISNLFGVKYKEMAALTERIFADSDDIKG